ncbi:MAG: hypothetical protein GXP27_09035 [Planctomycetes bacterium]|nr:hypothetical protein [Planctomycetota bacterium]
MIYIAANRLGCSPQTIYTYARKYPDIVQRAIDEARGLMLDTAEMKLCQAIAEGESRAICFYLKCQGGMRHGVSPGAATKRIGKVSTGLTGVLICPGSGLGLAKFSASWMD